ncbi:MAG: choice-of-anchor J domain-containing protein, partial [Psychroflexus sp.]|nr:choice-of-anchor J domain-containing protein [Psychroflexus sp.]
MKLKYLLLLFIFFTLNSLSAQCDFAVELKDSESNGWAGSSLDLSVNGTLIYDDLSISNGQASEVFTFSVNNNDAIEVIWNSGSVGQDETSYSILDNTGSTLITKTATDLQSNEINVVCATCPLPQNIQLEYANDPLDEVRFSFDLPSSQQLNNWTYEWVIMPQGQMPDASTAVESGTVNFNFYSELKQEITTSVNTSTYSNFDFYIRTNCEDLSLSQWSSKISFCLNCGQSNPLKPPYFENFFFNFDTELGYTEGDGGSLASGPSVTGQGNWTTDFFANGGVGSDGDSFKVSMDGSDDVSWLILPTFDLSDADHIMSYKLAVTADNSSTSGSDMGSDDVIYLAYKTSGSSSWAILEDYDNSDGLSYINNGTEEIDLSAISSSSVQIAFVAFENTSDPEDYDFFVDDIRLEKNPCQSVFQNLSLDQVYSNTADISWDASPDEVNGYDWFVFNDNDNPLFATPVQTGTTSAGNSQVSITGLVSQTDYDFYVKTNCSSSHSKFSPVLDFSTVCGVFSAPFVESFEPTSNTEECWTTINADNDNEAWNLDDTNGPNQGTESAAVGGIADDGDDDWLISPQLNLSGSEQLQFFVRSYDSNNPSNLEVLLSTTGNDPADFTTVLLPNNTINTFNYILKTIDLSTYSGNVYIAWYVNNTADSYGLFVDDIEIIDCSSASIPYTEDFESGSLDPCWSRTNPNQSFVASNCGSNSGSFLQINGGNHSAETKTIDASGETSIDVSWDIYNGCNNGAEFGETLTVDYWDGSVWQTIVTYDDFSNFSSWTTETHTVSTNLTASFKLRFQRAGGTDGIDDLSIDNIEVKTTPPCQQAPTVSTTPDINAVDLSWSSISDASNGYEWLIMPAGNNPDVNNAVANGSVSSGTTMVNVTGLNQSTDYDAYVRAVCGSNIFSAWSNPASFSTLAPPPPNDDACNAISITVDQTSAGDAYTLEGATVQPNEPSPFNSDGLDGTAWFSFVAPEFGNVQITTDISGGTLGGAEVFAYSVGDCSDFSTFTQEQSTGGGPGPIGSSGSLNLYGLTEGNTYYVQVDHLSFVSPGTFGLEVRDLTYTYSTANGFLPSDPNGQNLQNHVLIVQDGTAVIDASGTNFNQTIVRPNAVLDIDQDFDSSLYFQSDDSGFGQLANTNGGQIIGFGSTFVEHFIPVMTNSTRGFRFLTSSVNSFQPIYNNWQEEGNSPVGFGTHITGNNNGTNGVDQTISGNPSMFTFDNTFTGGNQDNAWQPITDTKANNLNAGEAYRIFIRGDRNYDLTSDPANPPNADVTLRASGDLVTGDYSPVLSDVGGYFSLVGNPYQAIVDLSDVLNNNSSNANPNYYWVWDPNISTQGAYVAVDLATGNNEFPDGSTPTNSEANEFVMPHQSFFVQTINNGAANLTFKETHKDVAASPTAVFSQNEAMSINIKLYRSTDLANDDYESDALQINFSDAYSNSVTIEDAEKLVNPDENLARLNNGDYLSIEKRKLPVDQESLQLYTADYSVDDYTFVITNLNLPDGTNAYLTDHYTNTQTLLSQGENQINFTISNNLPESIAVDRFSIDFDVDTFGVDDQALSAVFKVYPNPLDGEELTLQASQMSGHVDIAMYNMIG